MHIQKINPDTVRFNPVTSMFEALVTIEAADGTSRYPCSVTGTLKTPPAGVVFKLVQQAKAQHLRRSGLSSHTSVTGIHREHHLQSDRMARTLAA